MSNLRLPGALEPWEQPAERWIGKPDRIATALEIMIDGPLGGAAFNNEFGRPALLGYFRTFELASRARQRAAVRGYHKPIMLAGGLGNDPRRATSQKAPIPAGRRARRARRAGDADRPRRRRGVVAGAGRVAEDLDFASVQRDNAEMQRRCQEVIDRCWALGDANPILSIHDVGAGGLSNALPELVHDAGRGARLELRAIPSGEPGLSPLELWCNEAQERYVLAIAAGPASASSPRSAPASARRGPSSAPPPPTAGWWSPTRSRRRAGADRPAARASCSASRRAWRGAPSRWRRAAPRSSSVAPACAEAVRSRARPADRRRQDASSSRSAIARSAG